MILRDVLDEKRETKGSIRLAELFDRMVRYRNQELGHGAAGQREASFYERTGNAILEVVGEILGRVDVLLEGIASVATLAFSGDGRLLALGGESGVRLWDRRAGALVAHWPHPKRVHSVEFDVGGRLVLTAARDGRARVFAVPDGSDHPTPLFPPVRHEPADGLRPVFVDGGGPS